MDATDADGEWSDEELLRSGSQTGVSDDQDTGLSSGQDKCRPHRQKTDTSAGGSGSELPRPRHKNHHHRPSLGSLIKKMSSEHAQHVEEQYNSWNTRTSNSADIVCMPIVTSFPPTDDASAAVDYSSRLSSLPAETPNLMTSAPDPVSAILDKIDAQIDAMDAKDMSVVPKLTSVAGKNSRLSKTSSSRSTQSGLNASGDTGVGSLHDSEFSDLDKSKINLAGSTEMLSEPNLTDGLTDDERARRLDSDIPSDLDSVAAQQIDIKFKEIMKKKKVPPDLPLPPNSGRKTQPSSRGAAAAASQLGSKLRSRSATRPSATMLSTGYGTDNESVRTEEFETKFMSLLVGGGQGGLSDSDGGRSKPETPRRRPNSVPADTSKTSLSAPQPQTQRHHQPQLQQQPQLPVPGLAKEDEELLQKLARVANETRRSSSPAHSTSGHAPATSPAPIINRPRSVSPTRLRGEKKAVSIQEYTADDEVTARQIELESARIQREIERERRARSVSPLPTPRGNTPSPPPPMYRKPALRSASARRGPAVTNQQSRNISSMIANTSAHFSDAEDQLLAGHELKTLRQALHLTKKELRETEAQLKDARQLSEDAKSGLMVLEFKRGSATKDLDRLNEEIHRREGQISAVEGELQSKVTEIKNMTSLGVTREDCLGVKATKEENLCLKTKVRGLEGLQLERDELVRQLETAKEDLLREQKTSRLHRAELQEELETLSARLEESQNGWGTGQAQLAKVEAAFRRMEREKNEVIQEKVREVEEIKALHREEATESQGRLRKEMNELDLEVQEFRVRVNDLQADNGGKDTIIEKMRAQMSDLQSILVKEREDRHKTATEQKKALQHLKKETAAAVMKLKESLFLDKQKAVEDLKLELEQERRERGDRNEDRMSQMMEEHSYENQQKNQEIMRLQDSIRKLEKDGQLKSEQQVREAVNRERERSDKEKDRQLKQEREDSKRRFTDIMSQLDREKNAGRELNTEISTLKKELDEQRRLQREASKEKLVAVARTKEQMKDQSTAELDRVKFNLQQEHQRDMERLEEKLRYQEDELSTLKTEHDQIVQRERNVLMALEHAEKTVIKEINEECEKVSGILGVSPRTVHHSSFHLEHTEGRMSPSFRNRPVINSALANLRACNDELHNHILELQQEVESLKVMVETVTKEKEEAIENCKLQMEKQRTLDLEKLKDKLLKDHVQEMTELVRDFAQGNYKHSSFLQRYPSLLSGADTQSSLLAALQAKDDELRSMTKSTALWKASLEEKFNTQLQLQMAKEREKYQAQQHHSTREQSRINELQKQEITRLEREVHRLAASQSHAVQDSNRYRSSSPSPAISRPTSSASAKLAIKTTPNHTITASAAKSASSPSPQLQQQQQQHYHNNQRPSSPSLSAPGSPANIKSSQQLLQNRIEQLQAENAALRKNRLLGGGGGSSVALAGRQHHLAWSSPSMPDLSRPQPVRPTSPLGRARSPQARASRMMIRERIRQGEKDALEAEERARVNQKVMSNKMEEMAQLQNTLISQNQELQELEKAYNDLHKHYNNSRPLSPSGDFNTTL